MTATAVMILSSGIDRNMNLRVLEKEQLLLILIDLLVRLVVYLLDSHVELLLKLLREVEP